MIPILALFVIVAIAATISYLSERRSWNRGRCPDCATHWRHFDNDSTGARGYSCRFCGNAVWISFPGIDRVKS